MLSKIVVFYFPNIQTGFLLASHDLKRVSRRYDKFSESKRAALIRQRRRRLWILPDQERFHAASCPYRSSHRQFQMLCLKEDGIREVRED